MFAEFVSRMTCTLTKESKKQIEITPDIQAAIDECKATNKPVVVMTAGYSYALVFPGNPMVKPDSPFRDVRISLVTGLVSYGIRGEGV